MNRHDLRNAAPEADFSKNWFVFLKCNLEDLNNLRKIWKSRKCIFVEAVESVEAVEAVEAVTDRLSEWVSDWVTDGPASREALASKNYP